MDNLHKLNDDELNERMEAEPDIVRALRGYDADPVDPQTWAEQHDLDFEAVGSLAVFLQRRTAALPPEVKVGSLAYAFQIGFMVSLTKRKRWADYYEGLDDLIAEYRAASISREDFLGLVDASRPKAT